MPQLILFGSSVLARWHKCTAGTLNITTCRTEIRTFDLNLARSVSHLITLHDESLQLIFFALTAARISAFAAIRLLMFVAVTTSFALVDLI